MTENNCVAFLARIYEHTETHSDNVHGVLKLSNCITSTSYTVDHITTKLSLMRPLISHYADSFTMFSLCRQTLLRWIQNVAANAWILLSTCVSVRAFEFETNLCLRVQIAEVYKNTKK